jgi:hypothetical protein
MSLTTRALRWPAAHPASGAAHLRTDSPGTTRSRALGIAAVLACYIAASCLLFHRLLPHLATVSIDSGRSDVALLDWWLGWAPFSVSHGLNPLYTHYWNGPFGIDAMWNASILTIGTLLSPITLLFGAVATYNVAMILAPALSAFTCNLWLRRHVRPFPALVGGFVFGFSPFVVQQSNGAHLHVIWLVFVPLIVMLVEELAWRSPRPWWPAGPLLGLVIALQWFTSTEVLVITAIGVGASLVVLAVCYPDVARQRIRPFLLGASAALGVALVLVAAPLADQFSASHALHGPVQPPNVFESQPNFLVEAPSTLHFHTTHSAAVASAHIGYEDGLYLGIPLLGLMLVAALTLWRRRGVVPALLVASALFVLSLGGHNRGGPHPYKAWMPWQLVEHHLSLLQNLLPIRIALFIWLLVAFVVAVALDEIGRLPLRRWIKLLAAGAVCLCLLPLLPAGVARVGRVPSVPSFFTTSDVNMLSQGENVLLVPDPLNVYNSGFLWQLAAGMRFEQVGALAIRPVGPRRLAGWGSNSTTLTNMFSIGDNGSYFSGPLTPELRRAALGELHDADVKAVILGPSIAFHEQEALVEALLGRPRDVAEGGVEVWRTG